MKRRTSKAAFGLTKKAKNEKSLWPKVGAESDTDDTNYIDSAYVGDKEDEDEEEDQVSVDDDAEDESDQELLGVINEDKTRTATTSAQEMEQQFLSNSVLVGAPTFYNHFYAMKTVSTHDTPSFSAEQYIKAMDEKKDRLSNYELYLCPCHGPRTMKIEDVDCEYCYPQDKFPYTFNLICKSLVFTFPPTTICSSKTFNYAKQFIRHATADDENISKKVTFYNNFKSQSFIGGPLGRVISGKKSFVRKNCMAFRAHGFRNTLTIHSDLPTGTVRIPKKLYDSVKYASPIVVIARSPSISSECIYFYLVEEQTCDDTIHIPPDCLYGLAADQDGDDLSIFFLRHESGSPSLEMKCALEELRRGTWQYGNRKTMSYKPRHSLSQYHRFILHKHDDVLKQLSPLWASLYGDIQDRTRTIMALGCSIMHEEVDAFIELVSTVICSFPIQSISFNDVLNGEGVMKTIVNSGAKGSLDHITAFLENLFSEPDLLKTKAGGGGDSGGANEIKMIEDGFNKFIRNSSQLSKEGVTQFTLLYAFNSITLHKNKIYMNNEVLFDRVETATLMHYLCYN